MDLLLSGELRLANNFHYAIAPDGLEPPPKRSRSRELSRHRDVLLPALRLTPTFSSYSRIVRSRGNSRLVRSSQICLAALPALILPNSRAIIITPQAHSPLTSFHLFINNSASTPLLPEQNIATIRLNFQNTFNLMIFCIKEFKVVLLPFRIFVT
jgi:hypothetical protein